MGSSPIEDNDLWYHHIPGMLRSVFHSLSVPPQPALRPSQLTLGPSHQASGSSQLGLSPYQQALIPSRLAQRLTLLDPRPSQLALVPPQHVVPAESEHHSAGSEPLPAGSETLPDGSKPLPAFLCTIGHRSLRGRCLINLNETFATVSFSSVPPWGLPACSEALPAGSNAHPA